MDMTMNSSDHHGPQAAHSNLTHTDGYGGGYGNFTLIQYPELCTFQTCDISLASFNYLPNVPGNAIFAGIFGVLIFVQLYPGIKYKTWGYMAAMLLGLITEVIGYGARILVYEHPFDNDYFLAYLITLTIAPAFLSAGIYLCLSRIVIVYGQELSRIKPATYTIIFCTCDFISLVLQAVGGAIASLAKNRDDSDLGKNIMLAGLGFQVFSLALFFVLGGDFAWRVFRARGSWNPQYLDLVSSTIFKSFLGGLLLATVTIFIRCVYRCLELSQGFRSDLFRGHEAEFMILEGVMIVMACIPLSFLHPGFIFKDVWTDLQIKYGRVKKSSDASGGNGDVEMGDVRAKEMMTDDE